MQYYCSFKAVVVFFDVSSYSSFENIDNWLDFIPHAEVSDSRFPRFLL